MRLNVMLRALEAAKQKGYLVVLDNIEGEQLTDAYYDWCRENQKPYVRVKVWRKYAMVAYVMPKVRGRRVYMRPGTLERIRDLMLQAKSELPAAKQKEFEMSIDRYQGFVHPVPVEHDVAEQLAAGIAAIINEDLSTGVEG